MNCGGGRTLWSTWISCEGVELTGLIYQVDPLGSKVMQVTTLRNNGGRWESFAYDIGERERP
jgi:secreted PhoX family phosphatase